MAMEDSELKVFFLHYLTASHMIPLVDVAKLMASRGVSVHIITTPGNALLFESSIDPDSFTGRHFFIQKLQFPSQEVGLPEGIESFNSKTSLEMSSKVFQGINILKQQMEQILRDSKPDCIVSDMFFPWTVDIAEELGIPRISLNPSGVFYLCIIHSLKTHAPYERVHSEKERFLIPGLPDQIQMMKSELPDHIKTKTAYGEIRDKIEEAEKRSYGTIVNSFLELEHGYLKYYKEFLGKRVWQLGPSFRFSNRQSITVSTSKPDTEVCLEWLDSQKPNSVLYICFGSMVKFSNEQMKEISLALETSSHPFVWVVGDRRDSSEDESWLPKGFEERIIDQKSGMIIRGWAPQVQILNHSSIGGFVTHCGWNSIIEGITAGKPFISWPLFAEQFYNEKLLTQVLKIGVEAGSEDYNLTFEITSPVVKKENICNAINRLMGGSEEAREIRRRAEKLGEMAKLAVEKGESSDSDLTALISQLKADSIARAEK